MRFPFLLALAVILGTAAHAQQLVKPDIDQLELTTQSRQEFVDRCRENAPEDRCRCVLNGMLTYATGTEFVGFFLHPGIDPNTNQIVRMCVLDAKSF